MQGRLIAQAKVFSRQLLETRNREVTGAERQRQKHEKKGWWPDPKGFLVMHIITHSLTFFQTERKLLVYIV